MNSTIGPPGHTSAFVFAKSIDTGLQLIRHILWSPDFAPIWKIAGGIKLLFKRGCNLENECQFFYSSRQILGNIDIFYVEVICNNGACSYSFLGKYCLYSFTIFKILSRTRCLACFFSTNSCSWLKHVDKIWICFYYVWYYCLSPQNSWPRNILF